MTERMDNNSKRIIKNTGFLYIRMLLLMLIGLYTSRVILHNLGIEDYGIYNVVGGLTTMFAFFQSSLANATQRFLSVELGKGSETGAKNVFSQFFFIYLIFVIVTVVALETVGYWFISTKLTIPIERLDAALIVFHFTVISLSFTLLGTAFNSAIIAHEDMEFYSYLGVIEGVVKLVIAFVISTTSYDRLILYGALLMVVVIFVQISYALFCLKRYDECRVYFFFDKKTISEMGKFFSWNFLGTIIYMTKDQFINILVNIFFGPSINAARGISYQISGVVSQFTNSIYTSVQPQIVKSYAVGNFSFMHKLIFTSSKYSVMAFWTIALPVALNLDFLLSIWLVEVPNYTSVFTIWVLIDSTLALLTNAPWGAALATGNIRNYTIWGNGALLLIFPISYIALYMGNSPVSVFVIIASIRCLQIVLVVREANKLVSFGICRYLIEVMVPIIKVCLISVVISLLINCYSDENWLVFIVKCFLSIANSVIAIWFIGIDDKERIIIKDFINKKIKNIFYINNTSVNN